MDNDSLPKPPKVTTVRHAVIAGALLVFVDAFWFNQGAIACLVGAGLLVIGLPLALMKKPPVRVQRFRNLAIYTASVVLVFAFNALNNRTLQLAPR